MGKISFKSRRDPIQAPNGQNLMKALLDAGIPVASSCGGEGICGKCVVQVSKSSIANLSSIKSIEKSNRNLKVSSTYRLSCQCKILGDLELHTTYW